MHYSGRPAEERQDAPRRMSEELRDPARLLHFFKGVRSTKTISGGRVGWNSFSGTPSGMPACRPACPGT
jgi:hypothetical protein